MRLFHSLSLALVFVATTAIAASAQPTPRPKLPGEDWVALFNGKDLTGWQKIGDEQWTVEEGGILHGVAVTKAYGYLRTEKNYKDFQLALHFKCEGDGNSGVAQIVSSTEGAIGYVDLSDATENGLTFAAVQNKAGNYVLPTLEATTAAAEGAEINDDLTFFLGWADGEDAYPIAAQTWIIAYTEQSDPDKAEAIRGFLTYLLTDGQELATELSFAARSVRCSS